MPTDAIVKFVVDHALKVLRPRQVILFGSRARGDASERSDYDIAFDLRKQDMPKWARLSLDLEEKAPTLNKLDLVRLDQIDEVFKKRILSEGVIVYDEKS